MRAKLHLSIATIVLVYVTVLWGLYSLARADLRDQVRMRLSSLANNISVQIDASAHESLQKRSDENTPAYKNIRQFLKRMKAANPDIRYIYTMRPGKSPMVWEFVVDAETDPKLISHVGDTYDVSHEPWMRMGLQRPSADRNVTHDKWGYLFSGYAPIRDKNGKSVGIVGVDMSVSQLIHEMKHIRETGIACMVIAGIFSLALCLFLSGLLVSPLNMFATRLNSAAQGDLSALDQDHRDDEVGQITKAVNNLLSSLREKNEMLSRMNTDYLTGLPNHRYFQEKLGEEIDHAQEHGKNIALLIIDVDKLKSTNDKYGFEVGDEVLRHVSKQVHCNVDDYLFGARYGGEEFAVILPGIHVDEAVETAESIRLAVQEHDITIAPTDDYSESSTYARISTTVSVGLAIFPDHSLEQSGLIMAAEIALYRAKNLGRNQVSVYDNNLENGQTDPYQIHAFIKDPTRSAIEALAAAVDARDHYTAHHSQNVCRYSLMIADELGMSKETTELIHKAALLHDVGKIGVPDSVLNKPGALTDDEMELIRTHSAMGEAIVRNSRNLDDIIPGIVYHHERYDGKGYPHGLSGEDIPLLARIISVADTFDALTTNRPYRQPLSLSEAIEILKNNSGTQLDPSIVKAFIKKLEESDQDILKAA